MPKTDALIVAAAVAGFGLAGFQDDPADRLASGELVEVLDDGRRSSRI